MPKTFQITDAEWEVMRALWEQGPCTAAEVIKPLADLRGWNHRTVRTLLARLVEKGAVAYEVDGHRYIYRAAVSRERCVRQQGRSFVEKVFGGDVGALLVHFASEARLTSGEIEELRRLLEQKNPGKGKKR